jgi:hypothetical protein
VWSEMVCNAGPGGTYILIIGGNFAFTLSPFGNMQDLIGRLKTETGNFCVECSRFILTNLK